MWTHCYKERADDWVLARHSHLMSHLDTYSREMCCLCGSSGSPSEATRHKFLFRCCSKAHEVKSIRGVKVPGLLEQCFLLFLRPSLGLTSTRRNKSTRRTFPTTGKVPKLIRGGSALNTPAKLRANLCRASGATRNRSRRFPLGEASGATMGRQ